MQQQMGLVAVLTAGPQLAARQFLEQGYFHLAVSYFGNAQDWAGLGRAVDRVLDESLVKGPCSSA
jgi:nuclear pore complex protein Nup85